MPAKRCRGEISLLDAHEVRRDQTKAPASHGPPTGCRDGSRIKGRRSHVSRCTFIRSNLRAGITPLRNLQDCDDSNEYLSPKTNPQGAEAALGFPDGTHTSCRRQPKRAPGIRLNREPARPVEPANRVAGQSTHAYSSLEFGKCQALPRGMAIKNPQNIRGSVPKPRPCHLLALLLTPLFHHRPQNR